VDDLLLSLFRWNCWQDGTERHDGARCIFAGSFVPSVSRSYRRPVSKKHIFHAILGFACRMDFA
jgi:hypothetical protein